MITMGRSALPPSAPLAHGKRQMRRRTFSIRGSDKCLQERRLENEWSSKDFMS